MTQLAAPGNTMGNDRNDALVGWIDSTADGYLGHR